MKRNAENNPGLIDALGRLGAFASGTNAIIDAHDKLVRKRVIKPLIGGRRTVKKARRNGTVSHVDLPDDIVNRLGRETVDAIFASEDPAGTVRALMARAAEENDYWALEDYTRLLAILLAGGGLDWDETERKTEQNPISEDAFIIKKGKNYKLYVAEGGKQLFVKQDKDLGDLQHWAEWNGYRVAVLNPAYTVHVSAPSVSEQVEVHALTQGGALRKGRARLRGKAKPHPRWSVERNPQGKFGSELTYIGSDDWLIFAKDAEGNLYSKSVEGHWLWYDIGKQQGIDVNDTFALGNVGTNPGDIENYFVPELFARGLWGTTFFEREDSGTTATELEAAFKVKQNPSRKLNRKRAPMAVLLNPLSKRFEKLYEAEQNLRDALASAEYHHETGRARQIAAQIERVYKLRKKEEARIDRKKRNGLPKIASSIKSKLNKVSRMFHGERNREHGKLRTVEKSKHVKANHFTRNGRLPSVKLLTDVNGKHSHPKHACEECCIEFNPNTSFVGMTANKRIQLLGNGVKSVGRNMRRNILRAHKNGTLEEETGIKGLTFNGNADDVIDLGPVDVLWYQTDEKHSDADEPPTVNYYHNHGEDTGRVEDKPHLMLDEEGMFYLSGGNYTVTEAGIEN